MNAIKKVVSFSSLVHCRMNQHKNYTNKPITKHPSFKHLTEVILSTTLGHFLFLAIFTVRDHFHIVVVFAIILQYCLFSIMSDVISYLFISSLVLSIHHRPLPLFPSTQ